MEQPSSQGTGSEASIEQPAAAFFIPNNAMVPAQYFTMVERRHSLSPEKKLLWAVLESAVHDVQVYCHATRSSEKRLFREAQDWFTTSQATGCFSFVAICDAVGLEPDCVWQRLARWLVEPKEAERNTDEAADQYS